MEDDLRESSRYSRVCQICQIPYNYDDHFCIMICKNLHNCCITCATGIFNKNPQCPFCRQDFSSELKKFLSGPQNQEKAEQLNSAILVEQSNIRQTFLDWEDIRKQRNRRKFRCFLIIGIIFLGVAAIMFTMTKIYNRCDQYGYERTCYSSKTMCCPGNVDCSRMDFSRCERAEDVFSSAQKTFFSCSIGFLSASITMFALSFCFFLKSR